TAADYAAFFLDSVTSSTPMMSLSFMIRRSSPLSTTSVPDHLPNNTRSPTLMSMGISLPASSRPPGPTSMISPCEGVSFALSGMMMPPLPFASASMRLITTRSWSGRTFMSALCSIFGPWQSNLETANLLQLCPRERHTRHCRSDIRQRACLREKPIAICRESAHGALEVEQRLTLVRPRCARGRAMRRCERVSSRDSGRSRGSRHHKPETVTNAHYVPTFARIWPLRESGADRYVRPDSGRLGTLAARRREPSWHEPVTQEYEPISGLSTGSSLCRISHRGMSNWKNPFGWAWCPDGIRSKSVEHLCPVLKSPRLIACGGSRKSILHRPPSGNDLHLSAR